MVSSMEKFCVTSRRSVLNWRCASSVRTILVYTCTYMFNSRWVYVCIHTYMHTYTNVWFDVLDTFLNMCLVDQQIRVFLHLNTLPCTDMWRHTYLSHICSFSMFLHTRTCKKVHHFCAHTTHTHIHTHIHTYIQNLCCFLRTQHVR
jgi:hypothetical protein